MKGIWQLLGILGFLLLGSPAYAGGMADPTTYCGNGMADSTCLGTSTFNEAGWCQGGIVYQGQCITPEQYCTSQENVWYNNACMTQQNYCTSVLGKTWYNGQCMDAQTYCTAIGNVWYNGSCISPQAYCSVLGETWYNGQCMTAAQYAQAQCDTTRPGFQCSDWQNCTIYPNSPSNHVWQNGQCVFITPCPPSQGHARYLWWGPEWGNVGDSEACFMDWSGK